MQRESPTDATLTTHPSTMTNVTVVPDVLAKKKGQETTTKTQNISFTKIINLLNDERVKYLFPGNLYQF